MDKSLTDLEQELLNNTNSSEGGDKEKVTNSTNDSLSALENELLNRKETDPPKKKDEKIEEIPGLFEQQKQQVVEETEQVVLSDNIKLPTSIAKAEELLPQQTEMQAQVAQKTEEYLQDLTTLEEEQITFDDVINGALLTTTSNGEIDFKGGVRGEFKPAVEAFYSVLKDEQGNPLIDDINKLNEQRRKSLDEAYNKSQTGDRTMRTAYTAQAIGEGRLTSPYDRAAKGIQDNYDKAVMDLLSTALTNPENAPVVDRFIDKGGKTYEAQINTLLGNDPFAIYENEQDIIQYSVESFLINKEFTASTTLEAKIGADGKLTYVPVVEKGLTSQEDIDRLKELGEIISTSTDIKEREKAQEERVELISRFHKDYKVKEDIDILVNADGEIIRKKQGEKLQQGEQSLDNYIDEKLGIDPLNRNQIEETMIDLHYKIASLGKAINADNMFVKDKYFGGKELDETNEEFIKFKEEGIKSLSKLERSEYGDAAPVALYNKYVDQLNVLTSAYFLNFDPIDAFEKSGFTEGSKEGFTEDILYKDYGLTADDFSQTFVTTMQDMLGDQFEISEEELNNITERNWTYSVGRGFPGFVKMGFELAAAAGVGNVAGMAGFMSSYIAAVDTVFATSRTSKAIMKGVGYVMEEAFKLGIYNEMVSPVTSFAMGKEKDPEKIGYAFSALGGINYGYGKLVDKLLAPTKSGGESFITNLVNYVEGKVPLGKTAVGAVKGPFQALTGASLITAGGAVEGGLEVLEGKLSAEQFQEQYLSLDGFTQTAAMVYLMRGISPVKVMRDTYKNFTGDVNTFKNKYFTKSKLSEYSKQLDLSIGEYKNFSNTRSAERFIDNAVASKLKKLEYSSNVFRNLNKLKIDLESLLFNKKINNDADLKSAIDNLLNTQKEKLEAAGGDLSEFNVIADAIRNGAKDFSKFKEAGDIYNAGQKSKLYLEMNNFIEKTKSSDFEITDQKISNLANNIKNKRTLTADNLSTLTELSSKRLIEDILQGEYGVNQNQVSALYNSLPGYNRLIDTANRLGYEPGSEGRKNYIQKNLKLQELKEQLELTDLANKQSTIGVTVPTENLKADISKLESEIKTIADQGLEISKQKAKDYVERVKVQTEKAGGKVQVVENKDAYIDFLNKNKDVLPKEDYEAQMKLATDPTSRIDAANIVTNTGEKIQVFNIGDILKPKTVEINGQKVEYIDFTAGPHEPVHNFINSTIKQLGIESNKPALNNFVETFKSTLTDNERRVLESRLSKMPDYVANENTLEFFNVYAEALATGEIKYPEGQDAVNLLGEFNTLLENASGKDFNFTTTTERAAVESIKSIISEYTNSIVNDKVDNNESVNKFLEVSYSDQGYIRVDNKAEIKNYKGKAKQIQDQIKQNENLIKQLQAEGDPFGEVDAFKNRNITLQNQLDKINTNVDRAAVNLENIDILVNENSSEGQIRSAKNKIYENNAPLIQSVKNKFDYSKLDQSVDKLAAKENWDAQVDFYFSQLLNSYLNTYSRAAEAGVKPGEKFADPEKGKEYTLAEFGAYATRLKLKLGNIIENYGEETNKFKVSIDKNIEEGVLPSEIQGALSNVENFNIDATEPVKTEYKPDFGTKTGAQTNLIDISTTEFKNEKDFYTKFKNIVKGNSVDLYKELTGTEETRTINKEKLNENLLEIYPKFVEFVESESDFFRLRKGVFQNFYEGIFNTDANGNITSIKRVGVAEDPQYKAKIPTQQEFIDVFTKGENRDIKRNVENLAWALEIMNTKKLIGQTLVENNGVLNVEGKNISIINTATNPKSFAQLLNVTESYFPKESMEVLEPGRIQNKAEIEGARYGEIESKAVTELAKQGIKPYMLSQVSLSVSNLEGREREIALDAEYKIDDNRTLTGRDIQQMYLSELSDQIKAAPKETEGRVSLVNTTNQRIRAGKENEELYKEKDLTKKDFEDVNNSYNFMGKQGEANAEKREIVKPKLKKTIENPDGTTTKIVTREATLNKDNYDAYVDRIGNFIKKLPNKEFFEGTGITLEALIGEHMRTTGMGSTLINSKTGKEISIGRIIETLSKKGIEPGQDNKYFTNIDSKVLSSDYSQRTAAKKLLSDKYTKEQKDEIYKQIFTKKDAVARQKVLEALLLSKFDYVWEGKTKQDILDRYSDMAFVAKAESSNNKGQRMLASIVGAMYKDLPMEEIWVKLEHSTASVDLNTKVLDAIARGDRDAIIEISKTFEGVFGMRAQKEGSKLPEMKTTFDFYDKLQGTTYGESLKLLETFTTEKGETVRIADEIMMENPETGNIESVTNYVVDRAKVYAKENKISDTEVAAVEKDVTSNNFMVEYPITNPKELNKAIKNEVNKVKSNKQAAETNKRVVSEEVVKDTPGIAKLTENNDGATTENQLENNVFMDKIMDTRGVQDINYDSPTFKNYKYNAETGIAKQPNNTNKFQGDRKVILMGGSAGSGKSGIAKGFLKYLESQGIDIKDFEYLNVDTEKERLIEEFDIPKDQRKQADWQRSLDARLMALSRADMQDQMDMTIANGKGFILDGTLASYKNTNKLIERLENEGYEVVIVKADASLETKLQRNKAREERSLRDKIVTTNHESVESSFAKYESDGRNVIKVDTESFGKDQLPEQIVKEIYDNVNETIITKIDKANLETSERAGIQNKAEVNIVSEQSNQIFSKRYKLDSNKPITEAEAIKLGKDKKKKFRIMPLKARHAMPLLLEVVGKGDKKGLEHMETMLDLADQGKYNFATFKRNSFGSLKGLDKIIKDENIDLQLDKKMTDKSVFTREDAVRIYLWNKNGKEIPGLGDVSKQEAIRTVMSDTDLLWYANNVEKVFKYGENEYFDPKLGWSSSNIKNDLRLFVGGQEKLFQQNFKDYFDATFTEENLNKIRAGMGKDFDSWWNVTKDFADRQYTGRTRAEGEKIGQKFVNWLHGSTALALFGNVKSAATQLISSTIYLGGPDNGFGNAAKAYASTDIFKAMKYILKSDYLKDRRGSFDLALKELSDAEVGKFKGIYDKALNFSFLFSQLGDNAAITIGGAPMLLNKAKKYMKEGMGETEAYEKAMFEVAQFSESTQQSTWARNISYQQTTGLGKATLNFLSTNILYNNGALAESMKLQKGLGDARSVRTIVNRIGVQTAMFSVLSSGIQYLYMDEDIDPDKKEKLLEKDKEAILWNGMTSIINGTGISGRAATTMMGVLKKQYKFMTEEGKREADLAMELLQFSPSLSIKVKKIQQAEYDFRLAQKIYDKTGKVPTKQLLRAGTKLFSFGTNFALPEYVTTIEDKYNFIMDERYTFWQKYEAALSSVYAGDPNFYKDRAKKELDEAMMDYDNYSRPVQSTQTKKGGYQGGVKTTGKKRKRIGAN